MVEREEGRTLRTGGGWRVRSLSSVLLTPRSVSEQPRAGQELEGISGG